MASQVLDQISQAEQYKADGNEKFKEGNYKKALGAYHKVFCYVNGLQMPGEKNQASAQLEMMGKSGNEAHNQVPPDRVEDVKKLKASTHLNMAACYLKQEDWRKCIDSCGKSLDAGAPPSSKAYFRRGQARVHIRDLDGAQEDFEKARELDPNDKAIELELRRLKQAFSKHRDAEKKKFAGMFNKMSAEKPDERTVTPEQESSSSAAASAVPGTGGSTQADDESKDKGMDVDSQGAAPTPSGAAVSTATQNGTDGATQNGTDGAMQNGSDSGAPHQNGSEGAPS